MFSVASAYVKNEETDSQWDILYFWPAISEILQITQQTFLL